MAYLTPFPARKRERDANHVQILAYYQVTMVSFRREPSLLNAYERRLFIIGPHTYPTLEKILMCHRRAASATKARESQVSGPKAW